MIDSSRLKKIIVFSYCSIIIFGTFFVDSDPILNSNSPFKPTKILNDQEQYMSAKSVGNLLRHMLDPFDPFNFNDNNDQ